MDTLEDQAKAEEATEIDQETQPDETLENQDQETDQEKTEESETEAVADEEGSQPIKKDELTKGMQKRLAKEKSRQYAIQAELDKEREENAVLQTQIDAQKEAVLTDTPVEPNPNDIEKYPEGREDTAFIKDQKAFDRYEIKKEIVSEIAKSNHQNKQSQQANDRSARLKEASDGHYERAGAINVDDYLTVEKRAINIIGKDVAEAIVMDFDASQDLLYHLGDNTDKAREVSRFFKDGQAVKGLLLLKEIHDDVRVKKKTKKFAPDPEGDEERGKAPSSAVIAKRGPKGATYT